MSLERRLRKLEEAIGVGPYCICPHRQMIELREGTAAELAAMPWPPNPCPDCGRPFDPEPIRFVEVVRPDEPDGPDAERTGPT